MMSIVRAAREHLNWHCHSKMADEELQPALARRRVVYHNPPRSLGNTSSTDQATDSSVRIIKALLAPFARFLEVPRLFRALFAHVLQLNDYPREETLTPISSTDYGTHECRKRSPRRTPVCTLEALSPNQRL